MTYIKRSVLFLGIFAAGMLLYISCNETIETPPIEPEITYDLEQVEGTQDAGMTLSQGEAVGRDSWFEVDLSGIQSNDIIVNGATEGWCVEWDKNIAQNGDTHNGVTIYSTQGKERWKPLNYLLTVKDRLQREDPDLTFREIQAAIWSVVDGSDFSVDLPADELPPRLTKDGQPNFDKQKVKAIVNEVNNNASAHKYKTGGKHAVFIHSSDDDQTVTVPSDETVSHGYVEGVTPENIDEEEAERTYPVIEADWEGPGGDSRWLGWNLGATQAPESINDDSPESAGWYFQFNHSQGYYTEVENDQSIEVNFNEGPLTGPQLPELDSDWIDEDPCRALLGNKWRVPTQDEWQAVGDAGAEEELNLHHAGLIGGNTGALYTRGTEGWYWSNRQDQSEFNRAYFAGMNVNFGSTSFEGFSADNSRLMFAGMSIRCIEN